MRPSKVKQAMKPIAPRAMTAIAAAAIAVLGLSGAAAAQDDARRWQCRGLFDYVYKYECDTPWNRDYGTRLRLRVAEYFCDSGRADEGIAIIERERTRALLPPKK